MTSFKWRELTGHI